MKLNYNREKILLYISMIFYIICLFFDGYFILDLNGQESSNSSILILLLGMFGVGWSYATSIWLANPLLFFAWYGFFKKSKFYAVNLSLAALILAVSFSFAKTIITGEGPRPAKITGLGVGYWLWVASMGMALLASLLMPNASDNPERYADY